LVASGSFREREEREAEREAICKAINPGI